MTAAYAYAAPGITRVSPAPQAPRSPARHDSGTANRHGGRPEDRTPYWVFVRDPQRGLMVSDGMNYIGKRLADREAVKLARHYGQPTEVRRSPRA